MTESDTLDHITLDSDNILSIERFENNYYNHKNKLSQNQNGGNDTYKLKKNIRRLYNCYVLSQNLNQDKMSSKIKKRLDKKLYELKFLEGGGKLIIDITKNTINNYINKYKGTNNNELKYILIYNFDEIFKENTLIKLTTKIINSFEFKQIIKKNISIIIDLFYLYKDSSFNLEILKNKKNIIIPILQEFVAEIINKLINKKYINEIINDPEVIKLITNIEGDVKNQIWNTFSFGLINFNNNSQSNNQIMFSNTIINIITSKLLS
jgi:hypothetical protein